MQQKASDRKLIIIIPAYNEEEKIANTINAIPQNISGVEDIKIIVIDDGSSDNTAKEVKNKTVASVVSFKKNMGLGVAFRTGLNMAVEGGYDVMVNIDADGQFDPQDIPKLIQSILDGDADFVTASRFMDADCVPENIPQIKSWGNKKVAQLVNKLTKNQFHDVSCGFRAYGREAILNLNLFGDFTYTQETFLDLSFKNLKIKEIPVKVVYFKNRQSRVARNLFHYGWNILKIIFKIYRDYNPLSFFGSIGLYVFLAGVILDISIIIHYFIYGSFTPYKSIIFFGGFLNFSGFSIFIFGFLADMLCRIKINQEKLLYYEKRRIFEKNK